MFPPAAEWWPYAAAARQLYKRLGWEHCITHEQVLCADALRLRDQLAAADRQQPQQQREQGEQERGVQEQQAGSAERGAAGGRPGTHAAAAAGAAGAAPDESRKGEVKVMVVPRIERIRSPADQKLAGLALMQRQLDAPRAVVEAAIATEHAAAGATAAANSVAFCFVDLVRRMHHCRRVVEEQGGSLVVVAACTDMASCSGRASMRCMRCADQCYVCSVVLRASGERPVLPVCQAVFLAPQACPSAGSAVAHHPLLPRPAPPCLAPQACPSTGSTSA